MSAVKSFHAKAPAKINLSLDIVGRRADGYHMIKTIMQTVSLFDEVSFTADDSGTLTLSVQNLLEGEEVPEDERNIIFKAAKAFAAETGIAVSGKFNLKKQIPSEAGLGGGSSDAAAALMGLNAIYETELSKEELCDIGEKIGADLPFFIYGGAALCEGIGEIITPVPSLRDCYIVLAKGKSGISTKEAYAAIDRAEITADDGKHDEIIAALSVGDAVAVSELAENVFEEVCDLPDVSLIQKIMLENDSLCSVMSGSGSAVYGIFEKRKHAAHCLSELEKEMDFAVLCEPCVYDFEEEASITC